MKLLFYNHTGQVSGAERVMLMILERFDRQRFDTVLLCPAAGQLSAMARKLDVKTIAAGELKARFTLRPDRLIRYFASFFKTIRDARARVIEEAPEAIHANSIRGGLVMSVATFGLGMPIVWHAHDLLPRHPLSSAIRLLCLASRRNRIIAVSQAVASRFRGRLFNLFSQRVPVTVIHNAVDDERFQPSSDGGRRARYALGFTDEQLLVGTVGQLTPRKGQLELIQAFAEVARDFPTAALLIVGEALFNRDSEYAEKLKSTAENLGIADRVHFLGQREDVAALVPAMNLVVVNSRSEPFGLTVVEAMASGTPVLATAVDGIAEIIRHDTNGLLIDSGNQAALIASLRRLMFDANLRRRLAAQALRDVRVRFSSARFVHSFQSMYHDLSLENRIPHPKSTRPLAVKLSPD
jgi:glycosyltransferase involved in cell wall biosynthesis